MTPLLELTDPKPGDSRTAVLRRLTWLMDDAVRLPFGLRAGLDALIGLVPGLGDIVGGAAAIYGLRVAWTLGAPPVVLTRMVMNAGIDAIVGSIPILGDLFDVGFASHRRNLAILEHWLATPDHAVRKSKWMLVTAVATLVSILLAAFGLAVWMVSRVVGRLLAN